MSAGISNLVYHGNVFVSLDCTSLGACCFHRSRSHFLWEKFFLCFNHLSSICSHQIKMLILFNRNTIFLNKHNSEYVKVVLSETGLNNAGFLPIWFSQNLWQYRAVTTLALTGNSVNFHVLKMPLCLRKCFYSSQPSAEM